MTSLGRQRLAPIFVGDVAAIAGDALASGSAADRVLEIGGPETMTMREILSRTLRVAGLRRPIVPAPAALVKLLALPMSLLPTPPLTPDAVDFVNQPATVDTSDLLAALPRRLTTLEEGLSGYVRPVGASGPTVLVVRSPYPTATAR
jgi:NADH dehydrogenase